VTARATPGVAAVVRWEWVKLARQLRVRTAFGVSVIAPFVVVGVLQLVSAVPQDTLFGQYVHNSGLAVSLVVLGFCGQWVLPLLAAIVAGDIFSSEDRFGTWKVLLTRSCSRAELFAGKFIVAATYSVVVVAVLAVASVGAGLLSGAQPVIGLSGQLVDPGHATSLILLSWATQLPPVLGFCAVAVLLSVVSRNSVVGIGGPMLIGLLMQLTTVVNLPRSIRVTLLNNPFVSWHGFWVQQPFYGPLRQGLLTSAVWFIDATVAAWIIFWRRSFAVS
jgi:ABC-2 type transport system permease protein